MNFPDPLDEAVVVTEQFTQDAVEEHARRAAPQQVKIQNEKGEWEWPQPTCVDCEEDIEPKRLEMGRIRCVACQTILEEKEKRYGSR